MFYTVPLLLMLCPDRVMFSISQDKVSASTSITTPVQSPVWSRATSPINGRPGTPVARDLFKDGNTPTRVHSFTPHLYRSVTVGAVSLDKAGDAEEALDKPPECVLGPEVIFSNSNVSINNVCLNEELLKENSSLEMVEEFSEQDENLSKSVPNLQANLESEAKDLFPLDLHLGQGEEKFTVKKRAGSEPSIPHLIDAEQNKSTSS